MHPLPKVSIITVVFQGEAFLERTLLSVQRQTFKNKEYVVIDGGSIDGTLALIDKYKASVDTLISEPDKGLYDAMNKGLQLAKGDFVIFMNAGDTFFAPNTLKEIFQDERACQADLIYGETMMLDDDGKALGKRSELLPLKLPVQLTASSMQRGMVVCHQSVLVRRSLAQAYDLSYKYCADVDWLISILKRTTNVYYYQGIVSAFLHGGLSRKKLKNSLQERYKVLEKHFGFLPNMFNHIFIVFRSLAFILRRGKLY